MKFPQKPDVFQFQIDEKRFVLDIESHNLLEIEEIISDLLRQCNNMNRTELFTLLSTKYKEEEIKEALKELEILKKHKLFLSEEEIIEDNPSPFEGLSSLSIILTGKSNQACNYPWGENPCYNDLPSMTTEVVHKAIDFFISNSGSRRYLTVIFRGGEGLLNFDTLKYAVLYGEEQASAKGKKIDFILVTNGSLLSDNIVKYLDEHNIHIQIVLEGTKEIQDKLKPYKDNTSYYDVIDRLKAINSLKGNTGRVRSLMTGYDINILNYVKALRTIGFGGIHITPVFSDCTCHWAFSEEHLKYIEKEYFALADYYINECKNGSYFHYETFNNVIRDMYEEEKRFYYCGAGKKYLSIDPRGFIYPCHRFTGIKECSMGNVFNVFQKEKQQSFISSTVDTVPKCSRCWARYLCGGGCYFENYIYNKDIKRPYSQNCYLRKLEYKAALYAYSSIDDSDRRFISESHIPLMAYR